MLEFMPGVADMSLCDDWEDSRRICCACGASPDGPWGIDTARIYVRCQRFVTLKYVK